MIKCNNFIIHILILTCVKKTNKLINVHFMERPCSSAATRNFLQALSETL